MTQPTFEPYDELDQDAHDYLTKHVEAVVDQTAWQLVQRLNADRLDARRVANLVRDVRDAKAPFTTQIDGVKIARCDSRGQTSAERAAYQRGLRESLPPWETNVLDAARALARGEAQQRAVTTPDGARLFLLTEAELDQQTGVVDAEVIGSSAWLRDLANRVRTSTDHTDADGDTEDEMESALRTAAERVERDERQADADTRDRARVEAFARAQWTKEREAQSTPALVPTWDELSGKERDAAITYGLQLYRAGRADQEADNG